MFLVKNIFFAKSSYRLTLEKLLAHKEYYAILGFQNSSVPFDEVKKHYYGLIKQYHADHCHSDKEKARQYEQITKIVVQAYKKIEKQETKHFSSSYYQHTIEDDLAMELYSKRFEEVKYWLYKNENESQRIRFYNILKKRKGQNSSGNENSTNRVNFRKQNFRKSQTQNLNDSQKKYLPIIGIIGIIGGFVLQSIVNKPDNTPKQKQVKQVTKSDIENILEKKQNKKMEKAEKIISEIIKERPPTLEYPQDEDPHIIDQLVDFSIAQDLHLFEVPCQFFESPEKVELQSISKDKITPLSQIKPNTALTLNLEAERMLQNVYVRVRDVISEIEQKGKYHPPYVFFRFYGFIMVSIREKPISLKNYRDTDFISLFDLYFNYYSPIFFKKDKYSHYLVGEDDEKFFGWVHLNNRKTVPYYLKKKEKVVFMTYENSTLSPLYKKIWSNYYQNYAQTWKQI